MNRFYEKPGFILYNAGCRGVVKIGIMADHVIINGTIPESALDHVYYSESIATKVKIIKSLVKAQQ